MLKMIQIWPVGIPSSWLLFFDKCPWFLEHFLTFLRATIILYFLCFNPEANHFQQVLVPFSGCWYLETKIWALRTFISTGLSFVNLSETRARKYMHVCTQTHKHTDSQTAMFPYLSVCLFLKLVSLRTSAFSSNPAPQGSLQPLSIHIFFN